MNPMLFRRRTPLESLPPSGSFAAVASSASFRNLAEALSRAAPHLGIRTA
jgi:hypothetical protein